MSHAHLTTVILVVALGFGPALGRAQQPSAAEHAKQVVDLLNQGKFEEVTKEFTAAMSAAASTAQIRDIWTAVRQQGGAFKTFLDERVTTPAAGMTAVVVGCQFERSSLNLMIAFDAENKIAGLRLAPRPAPSGPPAPPPPSSHFTEESVSVGTGEWALPGTLSMPTGAVSGAIVLVHGSGPNDRDETIGPNKPFRDLAWGLADRGIAVLRYEKRTRQHGTKLTSVQGFTVREEATDDAVLAAKLLRAHDRIDPKRVFLLGHSLGGTLAPRIAAQDRALAGLVIMAGATRPILDVAREQLLYLASLTPGSPAPEAALEGLRKAAPESYWKDLDAYKPAQVAATLTIPMLILQGERDYQVSAADLQGWRSALAGHPGVTIKSYPTLNHLFMPGTGKSTPSEYEQAAHIPDFVIEDIAAWIKNVK